MTAEPDVGDVPKPVMLLGAMEPLDPVEPTEPGAPFAPGIEPEVANAGLVKPDGRLPVPKSPPVPVEPALGDPVVIETLKPEAPPIPAHVVTRLV